MAYIYLHRTNDTGEVFYVGKGSGNRATETRGRNQHWHRVVNKAGFTAEIIVRGLTDEEAYALEVEIIAEYGLENLVNQTLGGDGIGSQQRKEIWANKIKEEMDDFKQKMSIKTKLYWENLSQEELDYRKETFSITQKKLYKNMTMEQKQYRSKQMSIGWNNISCEKRNEINQKIRKSHYNNKKNSKLTETDIIDIRNGYNIKKITQANLSKKYNVSPSTISRIISGERWSHIDK